MSTRTKLHVGRTVGKGDQRNSASAPSEAAIQRFFDALIRVAHNAAIKPPVQRLQKVRRP